MALVPTATDITVREVLEKLDGDFAAMARAVQNGEYALWIGSGISRKAPSLGGIIARAIERLRTRAQDPATQAAYEPALLRAMRIAEVPEPQARPLFAHPFDTWPSRDAIVNRLWDRYSRVLDIRIVGEPSDFMLWSIIDIRDAFALPPPPAAQHLCIAILLLEGAIREMASANWDGFIEAAVVRLGGGLEGLLQPVIDPNHLRRAAGRAKLLKFHGCVIHATQDEATFRPYLVGSHTQITEWPNSQLFAAMRAAVTGVATNFKSLVLGLSIQDTNLQGTFSAAKQLHPWPWPCAPDAPGHVFCEETLRDGQEDVLKIVYGDAYNDDMEAIEHAAHLRAWAEQVLIALVLQLLRDKLAALMELQLEGSPLTCDLPVLVADLAGLFTDIAIQADGPDRTALVNRAISTWSRMLAIFRTGALPADAERWEILTTSTPAQLGADANARAAKLGDLGLALTLLQYGRATGLWTIEEPDAPEVDAGSLTALAHWAGADRRPIFLIRSAAEAIALEQAGAFANDNAIVIHADDVWHQMCAPRGSMRRAGRAPGRTGIATVNHVSVEQLVQRSMDVATLRTNFVAAVTL